VIGVPNISCRRGVQGTKEVPWGDEAYENLRDRKHMYGRAGLKYIWEGLSLYLLLSAMISWHSQMRHGRVPGGS
jgi:hypothetical protein